MPRHDRAYGATIQKRQSGGSTRRTRRRGKNTYSAKQRGGRRHGTQEQPEAHTAEAQTQARQVAGRG